MTFASPFLSADQIRRTTFVRHVEIHDSLDSTNNRAADLACDPQVDFPALIAAREQTAGRGRDANRWWSADGALTFSLLLEPAAHGLAAFHWPRLSLATAVAICDAVDSQIAGYESELGSGNPQSAIRNPQSALCSIKWPNDVLVAGRKIAGILLESPGGSAPANDRLILGIGLNVNNSCQAQPIAALGGTQTSPVPVNATALCEITGRRHDLQELLIAVLNSIKKRIDELRTSNTALPSAWQRLNHLTGRAIRVNNNHEAVIGQCIEIAADGALVVNSSGIRRRFYSGSVRLVDDGHTMPQIGDFV